MLVIQSCPTLYEPLDCSLPGSSVHGILHARILEWAAISPGGIFPTPGLNLGLLHCRQILYHLSPQGKQNNDGWNQIEMYLLSLIQDIRRRQSRTDRALLGAWGSGTSSSGTYHLGGGNGFYVQRKGLEGKDVKEWRGTSLVVQWLRLGVFNAGGLGLIPGQGTRPCMPQLRLVWLNR